MPNRVTYEKFTRVINATAAGTSVITGSAVDMQGFDGVVFVALFGTLTSGQVTTLGAGDSATTSGFVAITGAVTAALADADGTKMLVLDIFRPQKRYITAIVNRATQNAVIDGVLACQYAAKKQPTTQDTTVSASKFFVGL